MLKRKSGTSSSPYSFTSRLRHDSAFRTLLEQDMPAALHAVGIVLPIGVQVRYARDAATAIQMTLDYRSALPARELPDCELQSIAGGVGQLNEHHEEIQHFLSLLKHHSS